jgi:hypothetical protein
MFALFYYFVIASTTSLLPLSVDELILLAVKRSQEKEEFDFFKQNLVRSEKLVCGGGSVN